MLGKSNNQESKPRAIGNTNRLTLADGLANKFHPREQDPRFSDMDSEEYVLKLVDETGAPFVPPVGKVRARFRPD